MTSTQRLLTGRRSGSLLSRLGFALAAAVALVLTAGIVVAGFVIGVTLLGLAALAALVFWVRAKLRGGRRPVAATAAGRRPVVIDGEFVVLSSRPRSGD